MQLTSVLDAVQTTITDPKNGILAEINNLMNATDDKAKQAAVFTLIGTVINLVISIIKAAVEPAKSAAIEPPAGGSK